ncbi:hypothetical protein ADL21_07820 [Streptomyces albus subsp. albus]|nr:hypothetical protein ADL21_07820 [Streptomyces albus subsp. albus]
MLTILDELGRLLLFGAAGTRPFTVPLQGLDRGVTFGMLGEVQGAGARHAEARGDPCSGDSIERHSKNSAGACGVQSNAQRLTTSTDPGQEHAADYRSTVARMLKHGVSKRGEVVDDGLGSVHQPFTHIADEIADLRPETGALRGGLCGLLHSRGRGVPGALHIAPSGLKVRAGGRAIRFTGIVKRDLGAIPFALRLTDLLCVNFLGGRGGCLAARESGYGGFSTLLSCTQGMNVLVQGICGDMKVIARLSPLGRLAMETITESVTGFAAPAILGVDFCQPIAGLHKHIAVGEQ